MHISHCLTNLIELIINQLKGSSEMLNSSSLMFSVIIAYSSTSGHLYMEDFCIEVKTVKFACLNNTIKNKFMI